MANVFDYLQWRGDLLFSQDAFNTVDAVILSRLSYIKFDGIFGENDAVALKDAAKAFFSEQNRRDEVLWKGDAELLQAVAESKRFGDLTLSGYVDTVDSDSTMQFSALVIDLGDRQFISYRGTDNTIVGWQEDFAMFSHFPLPSQKKALEYFEQMSHRFDGRFILGGHSKGGNLAVYAAAFCDDDLRDRIDAVYSLDGPGFESESLANSAFDKICDRIYTYVPQSSVFGMLLEHQELYTVVQSHRRGFMQHDIYSWEIDCTELITMPKTTATSAFFDHTITDFFNGMNTNDRQRLADGIFEVLNSAEVETFDEMLEHLMRCIGKFLGTMKNMNSNTRVLILKQVGRLLKNAGRNLGDINPLHHKSSRAKAQSRRIKNARKRHRREKRLKKYED